MRTALLVCRAMPSSPGGCTRTVVRLVVGAALELGVRSHEVDDDEEIVQAMHMPNCAATTQGGYRLKPWRSVRGESASCPLDAAPAEPPAHHPPAPSAAPAMAL